MLLMIGSVACLAGALMNVAEPLLATGPLGAGSSGYSLLVAAYGGAMIVGSLALSRAGSRVRDLRRRLLVGLVLQGAGMIGSAAAPSLVWALASFALTGFGNALIAGPALRLFQELASERLLGRLTGLRYTLGNIAFVVAFLSAGGVLAALGVRAVFALGGGALLALAILGRLGFRPHRTSGEPLRGVPEPARTA
jgi:MFS family permease